MTEPFRNAVATHVVELAEANGRGWRVFLEMPRGRLADATRILRGGIETPSRNGLPGRLRYAAAEAARGKDPARFLRDGEAVSAVSPVTQEAP